MTGTRNTKVRENLLKEKKLTLEKAVDIARAAESTAAQIKVMSPESGLFAVKEQGKGHSDGSPVVTESRIKDCRFCGRSHDCLLYTSPSPRDQRGSRMPSSA